MSNFGAFMGMGGPQPVFMPPGSADAPSLLTGARSGFYPAPDGGVGYALNGAETWRIKADGSLSHAVGGVEVWRIGANGRPWFNHRTGALLPPGSVLWYAGQTEPEGFFELDGSELSRDLYADLFAVLGTTFGAGNGATTFNIADVRGYFLRAWDNGRGLDVGRAFGSTQSSQNLAHVHPSAPLGTLLGSTNSGSGLQGGSGTPVNYGVTVGSSGGSEARPINIALMAIVKW